MRAPSEGDSKISYYLRPCRDWECPHSASLEYIPTGKLVKPATLGKVIHALGLNFCIFKIRELDPLRTQAPSKRTILKTYRL